MPKEVKFFTQPLYFQEINMIIIVLILSLILLSVGLVLIYQAKNIKIQRINEINEIQQKINQRQKKLSILNNQIQTYQNFINNSKKNLNILHEECNKIEKIKQEKQKTLNNYYENLKQQKIKSFEQYSDIIDRYYQKKEKEFSIKMEQIEKQREQAENQLAQIKSVYQAATAARLRQQEDEEKWSFYKIRLTDKQATDISRLQEWKQKLYDPTIVSKIIWSTYILKPTSDLCNRVLGSKSVCGIYKITNKATGEVYIGQSVNIAQRWKTHIKCGLGIDASSTNKLYNIMQQTGVWNFTFELLEECSRDKLNEKERFWIEMYQSNKVGMNTTKGNK